MPQTLSLYDYMTGQEVLNFNGLIHGLKAEIPSQIYELSSMLQLVGLLDRTVSNLSGGEQRRLSLACSMIHSPKLLVLHKYLVLIRTKYIIKIYVCASNVLFDPRYLMSPQ
jgi:ABC-2 type transport system ATP-binding protein